MTKTITCVGAAALVACVSLVLSSCDGSSSTDSKAALPSLDKMTVVSQDSTTLPADKLRIVSLECTATNTASTTETGMVNFKISSSYGEWTATNASYNYYPSTGVITIGAGTATMTSSGYTVTYGAFELKLMVDMTIADVMSGNVVFDQYTGYQSQSAVEISGDFSADVSDDEEEEVSDTTVIIVAQPILITKQQ